MSKYVVSIGTICIDDIITCEKWPLLGDKALANTKGYMVGGMPYNTACILANSNVLTYMLDVIGNKNFKKVIISDMEENNINYSLCTYDDHETMRTVIINTEGERTIFVLNANDKPTIHLNDKQMNILLNASYVYTNIAEMKRIDNNKELIKKLLLNGVKIVYDIENTTFDLSKEDEYYFKNASILSFNEKGYEKFSENKKKNWIDFYLDKEIIIIITKGANGCQVITKNMNKKISGIKVTPIDTTGAGDTFNAIFISEQIDNKDILSSVKKANKIAALSTEYFGVNKKINIY